MSNELKKETPFKKCSCKSCNSISTPSSVIMIEEVKIVPPSKSLKGFIDRMDEKFDQATVYLGFEKVTDDRTLILLFSYLFRLIVVMLYVTLEILTIDLYYGILHFGVSPLSWNFVVSRIACATTLAYLLFLGITYWYFNLRNTSEQFKNKTN